MDGLGTTRLETFSDGIFAIAATLLVLELGVGNAGDLGSELLKIWPSYLAYVTSFLIIGVIWLNHHHCVSLISRVDRPFLFINMLLLLTVAFIPFPTKLVAHYLQKPGERSAVFAYAGTLLVTYLVTLCSHARLPGAQIVFEFHQDGILDRLAAELEAAA